MQKLDFLQSKKFKADPFNAFEEMRRIGPVIEGRLPFIGKTWLTTGFESTAAVLRDKESFVMEPQNAGKKALPYFKWWMPNIFSTLANNMLMKDEPDHRRLRKLVDQAFMRANIESMTGGIEGIVDKNLSQFKPGEEIDLLKQVARPIPLSVISELMGLPACDREQFEKWFIGFSEVSGPLSMLGVISGLNNIRKYLLDFFKKCAESPRPGIISALVEAEQDGHKLTDNELLSMAFLLLVAGHETTVHLITGGVITFEQFPDQKAIALETDENMLSGVKELLRYFSPVQTTKPRLVSNDMDFYGSRLKKGETIMALLAAANADPAKFDQPEKFDVLRSPNPHLGFGGGMHICLGMKLAELEAKIIFQKLYSRFPNLKLADTIENIEWSGKFGMRSVRRLRVRL